jgi:Fe-S-cluster containining protein
VSRSLASIRFAQEEEGGAPASAFRRAEALAAEAPGRGAWACAPGCSFCCHLKVLVSPCEARALVPRLGDEQRERVATNARLAAGLTAAEYRRARIRCALLDEEDRCTAYDVRPLSCRAHTSTSLETCERVYRGQATTDDVPLEGWLVRAVAAVRTGMAEPGEEELHAALRRALACGSRAAGQRRRRRDANDLRTAEVEGG